MPPKLSPSSLPSLAARRFTLTARDAVVASKRDDHGWWTGTREGIVSTVVAMVAAWRFGGAAGPWFAPDDSGWLGQGLRMAAGSIAMAALVCVSGSLLAGRNPIYWGVGMPLLVYVAGSFCACISGHAGASMFWFGAPLFCGLAITGGFLAACALDRGR